MLSVGQVRAMEPSTEMSCPCGAVATGFRKKDCKGPDSSDHQLQGRLESCRSEVNVNPFKCRALAHAGSVYTPPSAVTHLDTLRGFCMRDTWTCGSCSVLTFPTCHTPESSSVRAYRR